MRKAFESSAEATRGIAETVASRASAESISAGRILFVIFSPCMSKTPAGRLPPRQLRLSGKAAAMAQQSVSLLVHTFTIRDGASERQAQPARRIEQIHGQQPAAPLFMIGNMRFP